MNKIAFPKLGLNFEIDPVAFHFPFSKGGIHWYGILIALGIVLAVLYCMHSAKKEGENPDIIIDLVLCALPVAIVGARTYYVAFSWDSYKDSFVDVFKIWEGGLAIYGGIIGAVLAAFVFCRVKKLNLLKIFDIASMGLFIGQAIGRWGNFVNAEAFGGECGNLLWGMAINGSQSVHPTFLYESLWNILGFTILLFLNKKRCFWGFTFFSYIAWYGLGRFFIEGLRADSLYIGSLRVSQLLAAICFAVGITALTVLYFKEKRKNS